jgi:hypothetical protein
MKRPRNALPSPSEEMVSAAGMETWNVGVAGPGREKDLGSSHGHNPSRMSMIDPAFERRRTSRLTKYPLFAFSPTAVAFNVSTST